MDLHIFITGGLYLVTTILGVMLTRTGKPYNAVIFGIHKLTAVAAVASTYLTVQNLRGEGGLDTSVLLTLILAGLLNLTLFVTGALLSLDKAKHAAVLALHKVAPPLLLISTTWLLYLLA